MALLATTTFLVTSITLTTLLLFIFSTSRQNKVPTTHTSLIEESTTSSSLNEPPKSHNRRECWTKNYAMHNNILFYPRLAYILTPHFCFIIHFSFHDTFTRQGFARERGRHFIQCPLSARTVRSLKSLCSFLFFLSRVLVVTSRTGTNKTRGLTTS